MDNPETLDNIGYTRHRTKTNKTKSITQKTKKMGITDSTKNRRHNVYIWVVCVIGNAQMRLLVSGR